MDTELLISKLKMLEQNQIKYENDRGDGEKTEDFPRLLMCGLDMKIASKLDDIIKCGKLTFNELDARALDALADFPIDGAMIILEQFLEANLEHVSNKSAYLCGLMKSYRQNGKSSSNFGDRSRSSKIGSPTFKGPNATKIEEILARTGYKLDVTTGKFSLILMMQLMINNFHN